MRRADRLFQIVQYLRGGRLTTARRLAERLEVSERTIYRDIADLVGSGVPIEGEAGVGYVMRAGFDLPPLMFTRDEIVALTAGARMIRAWGGAGMARAAEEALVKIGAVLPEPERDRAQRVQVHAMAMPEMSDDLRARIDALEAAVEARERLVLAYRDARGMPDDAHRAPARALVLGQGLDAGGLVRDARGFPHVPARPDGRRRARRTFPPRAREVAGRLLRADAGAGGVLRGRVPDPGNPARNKARSAAGQRPTAPRAGAGATSGQRRGVRGVCTIKRGPSTPSRPPAVGHCPPLRLRRPPVSFEENSQENSSFPGPPQKTSFTG